MRWDEFIGLPSVDRGRSMADGGYDCWGLFVAAFKAGTGIDLPNYAGNYASAADREDTRRVLEGELGDWTRVHGRQREFDGVVMIINRRPHVGIVTRPGLMLHMPFGKTSVIEPISRYATAEIYRHRMMAAA